LSGAVGLEEFFARQRYKDQLRHQLPEFWTTHCYHWDIFPETGSLQLPRKFRYMTAHNPRPLIVIIERFPKRVRLFAQITRYLPVTDPGRRSVTGVPHPPYPTARGLRTSPPGVGVVFCRITF
jgi:hypothetical protein